MFAKFVRSCSLCLGLAITVLCLFELMAALLRFSVLADFKLVLLFRVGGFWLMSLRGVATFEISVYSVLAQT